MTMFSLLIFIIVRIILIGNVKARIIFITLIIPRIVAHPSSRWGRSGAAPVSLFINNTPRNKIIKKKRKKNKLAQGEQISKYMGNKLNA